MDDTVHCQSTDKQGSYVAFNASDVIVPLPLFFIGGDAKLHRPRVCSSSHLMKRVESGREDLVYTFFESGNRESLRIRKDFAFF